MTSLPADAPPVARGADQGASSWLRFRLVLDRVVATLVAVLTAPIVAVLAVLIRRDDGDPPLIQVPRVGRDGRAFGMWKLRSMRATSSGGLAAGSTLTQGAHDDRITPIGRRLRSYHLDELPQLWNVARGEMALLGPRPETPEFVDLNDERWLEILAVPPGIAGPTQLIVSDWEREVIAASDDSSGYRNAVLPAKLAIDRWYLHASSPATDLLVGATLLRRFLPGNEAWTLRHRVFADVPEAAPAHAFLRAHQVARHETRSGGRSRPPWTRLRERLAHELDARVARIAATDGALAIQPVAHDAVWSAQIDGEVVLYDAVRGLAHHLSADAAIIWQRCDGSTSVRVIARELSDALGVDSEQMLRDVTTVVLQLMDSGALVDARVPGAAAVAVGSEPPHPAPSGATPTVAGLDGWMPEFVSPTFDALGFRFQVHADDVEVGQAVAEALTPLIVDGDAEHTCCIVGRRSGMAETAPSADEGAMALQLFCDGEHLHTFDTAEDVLSLVLWFINQHAVDASELLAVHAAAVERDGQITVLPGVEGAGKSTLAAALVADGFGYITEEVLAIHPISGEVVPFPWPFRLEPASQALFAHLRPLPSSASSRVGRDIWFVDPDRVRPDSRSQGGTVRSLVVPAYRPGASGHIEDLTPARSLMKLLGGCMNLNRIGHEGFLRLVDLAWSVPGHRVEYSDLDEARRLVASVIDEPAAAQP